MSATLSWISDSRRFRCWKGRALVSCRPGWTKTVTRICCGFIRFQAHATVSVPNFNNLSLTVKREEHGLCSNYVCDLKMGGTVQLTGSFGSTFLLPNDPQAHVLMICTGTGSAPFRGFTMRRQRENPGLKDSLTLVFGARKPNDLPYFGPLKKVPDAFMKKIFSFSRLEDRTKQYVQDKLRTRGISSRPCLVTPTPISMCAA